MSTSNLAEKAAHSGDIDSLEHLYVDGNAKEFQFCMKIAAGQGHIPVLQWCLDHCIVAEFYPDVLKEAFRNKQFDVIRFLAKTCSCPLEPKVHPICDLITCTNRYEWYSTVQCYPYKISEFDIEEVDFSWDVMLCVAECMPIYKVYALVLYYAILHKNTTVIDALQTLNPEFYRRYCDLETFN
jgi:hypothetical protein